MHSDSSSSSDINNCFLVTHYIALERIPINDSSLIKGSLDLYASNESKPSNTCLGIIYWSLEENQVNILSLEY